ncbi:hypothetical protein DFH11DRAFT_293143 [Phellopilus nigrolimitatus]|nr:hypothetical protein DFH11DRAFT_293143 [Phellopilus nigrolimitatus]
MMEYIEGGSLTVVAANLVALSTSTAISKVTRCSSTSQATSNSVRATRRTLALPSALRRAGGTVLKGSGVSLSAAVSPPPNGLVSQALYVARGLATLCTQNERVGLRSPTINGVAKTSSDDIAAPLLLVREDLIFPDNSFDSDNVFASTSSSV